MPEWIVVLFIEQYGINETEQILQSFLTEKKSIGSSTDDKPLFKRRDHSDLVAGSRDGKRSLFCKRSRAFTGL